MSATFVEARNALNRLRGTFLSASQVQAIAYGMGSEESSWFCDKIVAIDKMISAMPVTYQQEGLGVEAIVSLHYFKGSADFWITERDSDPDGEGQQQAFGLADLYGDGGELGYVSIAELISCGVELDLHFKPRTLREVRADHAAGRAFEGKTEVQS